MKTRIQKGRKSGFTLLELLVVVGILAIVGTSLIVAYDGLQENAAQAQATHSIGSLDSTIRAYRSLNNNTFPDNFDSLMVKQGSNYFGLDMLPPKLYGKLGSHALIAEDVAALNAVGITTLRYVDPSLNPDYTLGTNANPQNWSIPNRIFDNPSRGSALSVPLAQNVQVAVVESIGIPDFTGSTPSDSSRLRDIANLDETRAHLVVAVGIGNNSTLVNKNGQVVGGLSEAPTYTNTQRNRYGRYIALFHLATDKGADGTLDPGDRFGKAIFLGVIDTKGDWLDEEYAEALDQKV